MEELDECYTHWFEMNDGEIICIQNSEDEEGKFTTDQILMPREMALELARDILHYLGEAKENYN